MILECGQCQSMNVALFIYQCCLHVGVVYTMLSYRTSKRLALLATHAMSVMDDEPKGWDDYIRRNNVWNKASCVDVIINIAARCEYSNMYHDHRSYQRSYHCCY